MFDVVIKRGHIATPQTIFHGWIGIKEGRIAALGQGSPPGGEHVLDAGGLHVLPGGIDPHVHFRDPGFPDKEDFASGTKGAAAGGVTTVFDMPNTIPAVLDAGVLQAKAHNVKARAYTDFGLYAAVDASNIDSIVHLADAGAIAFKLFMYQRPHPPPHGILNDADLFCAFEAIARTGRVACIHAENEALIRLFASRTMERTDPLAYLEGRPAICEVEAVQRAIQLAAASGVRLHICHLSSGMATSRIRSAKSYGINISAETGPQNLLLAATDYERLGASMKMAPPIRYTADQTQLWQGLCDGTIDMLATDHAPHEDHQKRRAILEAASGIPGVETTLPLMLTAVHEGKLSLGTLNRLRAEAPARRFGLYPKKGSITPGADADLVLLDLNREWRIDATRLQTRSNANPFDGMRIRGAVVTTMLRGTVVFREGQFIGEPCGEMVKPDQGD